MVQPWLRFHIPLIELHTRAVTVDRDTLTEGFSHFVASIAAPVASGWSVLPGGICTHWRAPPLHGANPKRTSCRPFVLMYNHPGGDPTPSRADIEITRVIVEIAKQFGIAIQDHIIVGQQRHASLKELKLI